MKIKFMKQICLEWTITLEQLIAIVESQFKDVVNTKSSRTIYIWRNKHISLDYEDKEYCSCYIELWNLWMRYERTLDRLIELIKQDPYIKRSFK